MRELTGRLRLADDVLLQPLSDGEAIVVILEPTTERVMALDVTATRMLDAVLEAGDVDAALPQLQRHFGVPEERLRADVSELMARLSAQGVLHDDGVGHVH